MNKTDYSKDAQLLDIEVTDFDTREFNDTGINDTRMRLPTRYDISKFYKRNKRNPERGIWKRKESKVAFSDDFDWQITYSFPNTLRNPKTSAGVYGGKHVTFRRLYLILCEHFNGGRFFIDDYFNDVYPHTVKPEVDLQLDKIKNTLLEYADVTFEGAVATKSGDFDRRYKANRGMRAKKKRYEAFAQAWEESYGSYLASIIKDDIINCLMSGQIPLQFVGNATSTKKARIRAGLSAEPRFFATAQLIESIQLYVKIGGNKQWRTKQGILV